MSNRELATLIAEEIKEGTGNARAMSLVIEGHIRDGMGRNWDVTVPAPTPAHRTATNSVRDLFDLA